MRLDFLGGLMMAVGFSHFYLLGFVVVFLRVHLKFGVLH